MLIIVSRDSCDVLDLLSSRNGNGNLFKAKHDLINSLLNTSAKFHWVNSSSNRFAAFFEDSTGKNRRGSSSITSLVIGFAGNLLDEVHAKRARFAGAPMLWNLLVNSMSLAT